jgi:hypothetical protein
MLAEETSARKKAEEACVRLVRLVVSLVRLTRNHYSGAGCGNGARKIRVLAPAYVETEFSKGHLSQILNGKREPIARHHGLSWRKALGVRVAYLFESSKE